MQDNSSPKSNRPLLGIALALLLATATFFSGMHVGSFSSGQGATQTASLMSLFTGKATAPADADLSEFWRVWELLDQKFAVSSSTESITTQDKIHGAIAGLVRAYGDPYTAYLPPSDAAAFDEDISGNFSGVGMEVGMRDGFVTVIAPLAGTPAEAAGILNGDVIASIDGIGTEKMSVDKAVQMIRGERGTTVTLEIARRGAGELLTIAIVREQIEIPTIKTDRQGEVFIITLYSFNALAEMKMQQALREYVQSDARKLILDMRGNPGGYLQSAVAIASYFLPTGKVILREQFSDNSAEQVYRSQGKTLREFAPQEMVVMIDGGSASASEILAGALAQHNIATLVGETSFGKGSVQELVPLKSQASLKVTVARWLTPDGTSISEGGLVPDIRVMRTVEDRQEDRDPQLEAALSVLRGTYVPPANEAQIE
ncbi:MAG: S41 family peptidase [Candidatus Paceibacteria bacterium]